MKRTDLVLDIIDLAFTDNHYANLHPQTVMKELGLTYVHSVPQSISDQWWFFGVEGDLSNLPKFIEFKDFGDLNKLIGYGLSKEAVNKIEELNK